ncbi:hypothetical protein DFJ74DRAFT_38723, partial [Hyaloraphidium curvatum]
MGSTTDAKASWVIVVARAGMLGPARAAPGSYTSRQLVPAPQPLLPRRTLGILVRFPVVRRQRRRPVRLARAACIRRRAPDEGPVAVRNAKQRVARVRTGVEVGRRVVEAPAPPGVPRVAGGAGELRDHRGAGVGAVLHDGADHVGGDRLGIAARWPRPELPGGRRGEGREGAGRELAAAGWGDGGEGRSASGGGAGGESAGEEGGGKEGEGGGEFHGGGVRVGRVGGVTWREEGGCVAVPPQRAGRPPFIALRSAAVRIPRSGARRRVWPYVAVLEGSAVPPPHSS